MQQLSLKKMQISTGFHSLFELTDSTNKKIAAVEPSTIAARN
jgi:hypothetical protein